MNRTVEILVTFRRPELAAASALVLDTVRTGFPTAKLVVHGNSVGNAEASRLRARVAALGGEFTNLPPTQHAYWLLWRLEQSDADELVILDGDLVLHEDCEQEWPDGPAVLRGPAEPEVLHPWTQARHAARLHTCFWRVRPAALRAALDTYRRALPPVPWKNPWHPTAQAWLPGSPPEFHDTGAGLCRVVPTEPFTAAEENRFTHLHCGTYSDLADARGMPALAQVHAAAVAGRLTAEGFAALRAQQRAWYRHHTAEPGGGSVADDLVALSHRDRSTLELALRAAGERPLGLEIGCYKGETSRWLLEHGLERLTVVDPFTGPAELGGRPGLRAEFARQMAGLSDRLTVLDQPSAIALPLLCAGSRRFQFIYVDGSHDSRDVLPDSVLAWHLLAPDGVLVFDDYEWPVPAGRRHPRVAIDAFLDIYAGDYLLLAKGYQVAVQKPMTS